MFVKTSGAATPSTTGPRTRSPPSPPPAPNAGASRQGTEDRSQGSEVRNFSRSSRRPTDHGPRTTDHGPRTTDPGPRTTDHGMRALRHRAFGPPAEVLRLDDTPTPQPGPLELRVPHNNRGLSPSH